MKPAAIVVVEGVFDSLTLRRWGYPAVALLGTHIRPELVEQLRKFERVYLVLDQDDGGLEAAERERRPAEHEAVALALTVLSRLLAYRSSLALDSRCPCEAARSNKSIAVAWSCGAPPMPSA